MLIYERELDKNVEWAVHEGGAHFEGRSAVQKTLYSIAEKLDALGIPYAVAGGMALFLHGYRRFTEDVDILVDRQSLERIHKELEGRGYLPPFAESKNLRDTQNGVRIEFLVAGEFPGDGKPKPVSFPDPAQTAVEIDGIRVIGLTKLIELKLASGTVPHRLRDLSDVLDMIETLGLSEDLAVSLDVSVRPKYIELWQAAQQAGGDPDKQ